MRTGVSGRNGRVLTRALLSVLALMGAASVASAQTTVTLSQPTTQVVSATLRGGTYATQNEQWTLETRASDNLEYNRRALLKFDTETTIPKGSVVTSALMTVTVKTGSSAEQTVRDATDLTASVAPWLQADHDGLTGKILKWPDRGEIDTPVQESLIVELYSK